MSQNVVKRGALCFKGEKPLKARKRIHIPETSQSSEKSLRVRSTPELKLCEGRVVANGMTLHGMETRFKEELDVGDVILLRHPQTLHMEERGVLNIPSQRSLTLQQPFSSDFVSTTEFWVRKDSQMVQRTRDAQSDSMKKEESLDENPQESALANAEDILHQEHQRKLSKEKSIFTYQEKVGSLNYKTVSVALDKQLSQEELLDMRCKKVHDKYC